MKESIFRISKNCSSIEQAAQIALLIDGDEYFQTFFDMADQAKQSIDILGWEVDSRIGLGHIKDSYPDNLRVYFNQLIKKNKQLHINIMSWKPSLFLLFDRELFASIKWKIKTSENIRFKENRHLDLYGTFHEKLAVIDESCAFIGGMDITRKRWDTSEHRLNHPLRKDLDGRPYHPIHDIQMICTGKLAQELSRQLLKKNQRPKNQIPALEEEASWPRTVTSQLQRVPAAISRTKASGQNEIESLYYDAIESAQQFIYIENQYFSHHGIISLLCEKLMRPQGPEIIIVIPYSYRGLFEKAIYVNERNKAIKSLQNADRYHRLAIFYPGSVEENSSQFIVVHSKFMVIDNTFLTLGSANLNHRSMRVDHELNVSIEALENEEIERFIGQTVYRLISEHLDVSASEIQREFESRRSLLESIKVLNHQQKRALKEMPLTSVLSLDRLLILLTPFVDIQYSFPKAHFIIFAFIILLMSLIFMKAS